MSTAFRRRGRSSPPRHIARTLTSIALAVAVAWHVAPARTSAQTQSAAEPSEAAETSEQDEGSPLGNGLVARYTGADGAEHVRLEQQIAFAWGNDPPDRRVPAGPFRAQFNGTVEIRSPGPYRLRVFGAGDVRLVLNGKLLLDESSPHPQWFDAEAVDLPFGHLPLEVRYRRTDEPARLALFWEGPQFELEPIAVRWLFHEKSQAPSDAFERGERLVRALRCAACHDLPGESPALPAPALISLAGNISRPWLVDWLASPSSSEPDKVKTPSTLRRMPHFSFARDAAEAVADLLFGASEKIDGPAADASAPAPRSPPAKKKKDEEEPQPPPPSAAIGATLFHSLGCLGCHRVGDLGSDDLFGGGDLTYVADKRPADFFARWLTAPAALNRDHRMPVFALDPLEIESLALYLETLRSEDGPSKSPSPASTQIDRGRRLVQAARCGQCHRLPKAAAIEPAKTPAKLQLAALERDADNCLGAPAASGSRPGYDLRVADRRAVAAFVSAIGLLPNQSRSRRGANLLVERNCLGCHARGQSRGLAAHLPAIADTDPSLRDVLPALAPPSLLGVGDKLHERALQASITVSELPRHDWLRVRMPRFPLDEQETIALVRHLVDGDRIPDRSGAARANGGLAANDTSLEAAGARLVTADGFGCTSCHAIGKWTPQKVALNAQGSDLSQIGDRVRREWFDRWVRDPARIVPQMEMPAVQQSVRGVLEGRLDRQLAAVWQVLNRKGFTPPSPSALRVLRRANLPALSEPSAALTDVIEVEGRPFVKPLVVGLANRHNVLFDLASNRLAAWWVGDTARQQTRGKSWHWEAGIPQLLAVARPGSSAAESELRLVQDEARVGPASDGDYLTEFDWFEHIAGGLRFSHRLRFRLHEHEATVRVQQSFAALPAEGSAGATGFSRRLEIGPDPDGSRFELLALPGDVTVDSGGRAARLQHGEGGVHIVLRWPPSVRLAKTARGAAVVLATSEQQLIECVLEYRANIVPDEFAPLPQPDRSLTRQELKVVPGFEAVRLGVTDQAMPTGLAWRSDGTLVVSSLEGRVWLGHDTDGDGLEDRLLPFSDELAAPFGVAAFGQAIDVINKYGLLRLSDSDGDGHADRTELLSSGWGHTRDYHDWAVGLPRDAQGNYYVSLPCQQDERTEAGATLRGSVIKLVPREPSLADPRSFAIEPLCAGLRFPQGIALSSGGDLFVTDNQGNYTPFNELNHVVRGARYGFINRLESKRGLNPPFRPAAVEIPHPWTRSVNGICFLEAPPGAAGKTAHDLFGPFAGQLIGCEYDTRRLVRMSLERVGDDFQGAVYPFSVEPANGEETFEGPLVCQVAPNGDIYIGNLRDSGWGAGSNTGSLVRLRKSGEVPAGIAEVRLARDGFTINFTRPLDRARMADPANYSVASYRRIPTPDYGAPDQDRRTEKIKSVEVSEDGRRATLRLDGLREGFVFEFHVRNLADDPLFPAEAYYTLRHRLP